MLFAMLYQAGQTRWERFVQTPAGKLKMHCTPSEEYRVKAKELFLVGFGHGFFDRREPDLEAAFESNWQNVLDAADGSVLLTGDAHPGTAPTVLAEAKRFYRFGYTYGLNRSHAAPDNLPDGFSVTVARID